MSGGAKSSKFNFNDALFYAEISEKEFHSRLRWFEKNYAKVYESKPPDFVPKKAKILYEEIVRRRLVDAKHAPRFAILHALPSIPKPDPTVHVLPPMRPVPSQEQALLKEGSEAYLKSRYHTSPDKRFYYPATTNWAYGWLAENSLASGIRIHGRKNIIKATFLRRNGVHPELPHYQHTTSHNFDFPFL